MTDNDTATPVPDDLREETAEAAPEVAEHDRAAELEGQLAEAKQAALYAQAEVQNVRRRAEKEAQDARQYAATSFARDILSVADNLERALAAIPAELREDDKMKGLVAGLEAFEHGGENGLADALGPAAWPQRAAGGRLYATLCLQSQR